MQQNAIIPAIIPTSLRNLREQIASVPFAPEVQIDVVDGKFVPFLSWPYSGEIPHFDLVEPITSPAIEIDLMVENPLAAARQWLMVGATRLVFHVETLSASDYEAIFNLRDEFHFSVALCANNDTSLRTITTHLDWIDYVQLMGIAQIGTQGQPFDERVLERVATLRQTYPELLISIDGSVNSETLPHLKVVGANRFVVGSAIMSAHHKADAYDALLNL